MRRGALGAILLLTACAALFWASTRPTTLPKTGDSQPTVRTPHLEDPTTPVASSADASTTQAATPKNAKPPPEVPPAGTDHDKPDVIVPEEPRSRDDLAGEAAPAVVRARVEKCIRRLRAAGSADVQLDCIATLAIESGRARDRALLDVLSLEARSEVLEAAAVALATSEDLGVIAELETVGQTAPPSVRMAIVVAIDGIRARHPDDAVYFRVALRVEPVAGDFLAAVVQLRATPLLLDGDVEMEIAASGRSRFPNEDYRTVGALRRGEERAERSRLAVEKPGRYVIRGGASMDGTDGRPRFREDRIVVDFHADAPPTVVATSGIAPIDDGTRPTPTPTEMTDGDDR